MASDNLFTYAGAAVHAMKNQTNRTVGCSTASKTTGSERLSPLLVDAYSKNVTFTCQLSIN